MQKRIYFLLLLFFIAACQQIPEKELPILGLWKLHVMEIKEADTGAWKEWRQGMGGYLLYEKSGYMSLHLMPKAYPKTDLSFKNFTDTMPLEQLKYCLLYTSRSPRDQRGSRMPPSA